MKNLCLLVLLFLASTQLAQAQVGLGLGLEGLNFKSSAQARHVFMARGRLAINSSDLVGFVEAGWFYRAIKEEKARLYLGASFGSTFGAENSETGNVRQFSMPVGVEYFPFTTRVIGLNLEAGPRIFFDKYMEPMYLGIGGTIEFTYYFARRKKD
ncbi:MAG: hypothetical protein MUC97_15035 [Bernardetiaceae bacterium]|jgi:hypothetical protein|nr:hypothetical protein [Bernardetiaceae bacterium]